MCLLEPAFTVCALGAALSNQRFACSLGKYASLSVYEVRIKSEMTNGGHAISV